MYLGKAVDCLSLRGGIKRLVKPTWLSIILIAELLKRRRTAKLLKRATKLHLGCGSNHFDGWANIDFFGPQGTIKWNLTKPLPAKSASIRFIYAEHFIEHLTRREGAALLRNCFELLTRGGVIRISTPNLEFLVQQYRLGRTVEWRDVGWSPMSPAQMLNESFREWGHQFVYDANELLCALREAGFENPSIVGWRESRYLELRGRERRPCHGDLIVEAVK
jgi:predicted SAM-dependent methyltransferase